MLISDPEQIIFTYRRAMIRGATFGVTWESLRKAIAVRCGSLQRFALIKHRLNIGPRHCKKLSFGSPRSVKLLAIRVLELPPRYLVIDLNPIVARFPCTGGGEILFDRSHR